MAVTLLVSSPHSKCPDSKNRQCDLAAGIAAHIFCKAVEPRRDLIYYYVQGNEFRVDHDLNRKASRSTEFRRKLREFFHLFSADPTIMVDIHSFPDYWVPEAKDINFFKKDETPPELAILEGKLDNYRGISLSNTIEANLRRQGVRCKIIRGIKVNDILNEASENGIPGVLLEYNEKFINDTTRLKEICNMIAHILSNISHT